MPVALNEESTEFIRILLTLAVESNNDEEFLYQLRQLGAMKAGGLRGHFKRRCGTLGDHIERLMLDRKMIARLVE